jgi:hypothetical protein
MALTIEKSAIGTDRYDVKCFIDGVQLKEFYAFPQDYDWDGDGTAEATTDAVIIEKIKADLIAKGFDSSKL